MSLNRFVAVLPLLFFLFMLLRSPFFRVVSVVGVVVVVVLIVAKFDAKIYQSFQARHHHPV